MLQFVNPDVPGYVGFANLPNQVHRKSVKKGFEFTLMVVGKSLVTSAVTKSINKSLLSCCITSHCGYNALDIKCMVPITYNVSGCKYACTQEGNFRFFL